MSHTKELGADLVGHSKLQKRFKLGLCIGASVANPEGTLWPNRPELFTS